MTRPIIGLRIKFCIDFYHFLLIY